MKRLLLLLPLCLSLTFVSSAQSIPNPDFENWSSAVSYDQPDSGWATSNPTCIARFDTTNVTKILGASGNAIKLHTIAKTVATGVIDTQVAYIANTRFMPFSLKGGAPYVGQLPSHLNVSYMCNVAVYDTAFIMVIFKKSGLITGYTPIKFWGIQSSWKDSSFVINPPVQVDSVIVAVVSSNILANAYINPNSWIAVDEMFFVTTGNPVQVPGSSFDNFATPSPSIVLPTGWAENGGGFAFEGATQTTSFQHGAYGMQLISDTTGGSNSGTTPASTQITSGYFTQNNGPAGGLAYTYTGADTLSGYYDFLPVGTDTASITVDLEQAGNIPVTGFPKTFIITAATSTYTQFKLGWPALGQNPATMRIDIASSGKTPQAGTKLQVDNLSLKSQSLAVQNINWTSNDITVYPNPANDVLNITFNGSTAGNVNVRIYDMTGRTLLANDFASNSNIRIPVSKLPAGMYFYEVKADGSTIRNKFIKQ